MDEAAGAGSKREHHPSAKAGARALASVPLWLRVAAAAYAVVGLFGLAYLVISLAWERLSPAETAVGAGLVAAPLAVGLLWSRLTGFKAFGVELSLREVAVQLDTKLATTIMSPDLGSGGPALVAQMKAIARPGVELLEVDLRDGTYWWSTRLYLLAALAQDLSDVRAIVFVSGGAARRFVGIARPGIVRRALAAQTRELEETYLDVARPVTTEDTMARVEQIVSSWTGRNFGPQATKREGDFADRISTEALGAALSKIGRRLVTDSIDWPGCAEPRIVRALVSGFDGDYVALLRQGSLDRIVDRHALAVEIAAGVEG